MIRRALLSATLALVAVVGVCAQPVPMPPPGVYPSPVTVHAGADAETRGVEYRFAGSDDPGWVDLAGPVNLGALPGEERTYTIYARHPDYPEELGPFTYVIDRRTPAAPSIQPVPGTYTEPIALDFSGQEGLMVLAPEATTFAPWDGEPAILDPGPGNRAEYAFSAYARDAAGNASETHEYRYVVDRTAEQNIRLEIYSPVSGSYRNPQYLVARARGADRIEYSAGGSWTQYTGPTRLPTGDDQHVAVRALLNGVVVAEQSARFSAGEEQIEGFGFEIVTEPTTLATPGVIDRQLQLSTTGPSGWVPLTEQPRLEPTVGLFRSLEILIRDPAAATGSEEQSPSIYRYLYVLDGSVPTPPEIRTHVSADSVRIAIAAGREHTVYLTTDGSDPGPSAQRYDGPFSIPLPPDSQGAISIAARAFGGNGRSSRLAVRSVSFNTIAPSPPLIRTTSLGGTELLVRARPAADAPPGTRIVYESQYGGTQGAPSVPAPTADSPVVTEDLVLTVPYGMTQTAAIRLASLSPGGRLSGSDSPIVAVLDRQPPAAPAIDVAADQFVMNGDGELYYRVLRDGVPTTADYVPYVGPVDVPAEGGRTIAYSIEGYASDGAGNKSAVAASRSISVRAPIPTLPALTGLPDRGRTIGPVTIGHAPAEEGVQIRYTLTTDGSLPTDPTAEDPLLGRLSITGEAGQEQLIRLKARPFVGSTGSAGRAQEFSFILDRRPPDPPREARLRRLQSGASVLVALEPRPSESLYYAVGEATAYEPYTEPFVLSAADRSVVVSYYATDVVGNRSDTVRTVIEPPATPPAPGVTGISHEAVYGGPVVIEPTDRVETVVYELGTQADPPPNPTADSPNLQRLKVNAVPGEVITYQIALRSVIHLSSDSQPLLSDVVRLSFTIDRLPPAPPTLEERTDDGRREVVLRGADGTVFYRTDESEPFSPIDGPIALPESELSSLRIAAYTEDEAGNRSDTVRYIVYADENVVYVDPRFDGTSNGDRQTPYATLTDALSAAAGIEDPVLFLAGGTYVAEDTIVVDRSLSIIAGLDPVTWAPGNIASIIRVGREFSSREALFSVIGGSLRVQRLSVEEPKGYLHNLIVIEDGSAEFDEATLRSGGEGRVLSQAAGSTTMTNVEIGSDYGRSWPLIDVRGGRINLSNTQIAAAETRGDAVLLGLADAKATIDASGLLVNGGMSARALVASDSNVSLTGSRLSARGAQLAVVGFEAARTQSTVENTTISATGAATAVGLILRRSATLLHETTIEVSGERSVQGLLASGGSVDAVAGVLTATATDGFAAGATGDQADLSLTSSILTVAAPGDAAGVSVLDAPVSVLQSAIAIDSGTDGAVAVHHGGQGSVVLFNNVFAALGPGTVVGIHLERLSLAQAAGNAFSEITPLLTVDRPRRQITGTDELDRSLRPEAFASVSSVQVPAAAFGDRFELSGGRLPVQLVNAGADLQSVGGPDRDAHGRPFSSPPSIGPLAR